MGQRYRHPRRRWFHILLLWGTLLAFAGSGFDVAAQVQTSPPKPSLTETAAFLGALPLPQGSPLYQQAQTATYRRFVKAMQNDWKHFERVIGGPMRSWVQQRIPERPTETVLYPFAGPDFLNAHAIFPGAKQYVLIGLEHGGQAPDLTVAKAETLAKGLTTFRRALRTLMYVNFFVTNRMEVDIDRAPIPGVTPVVLAAMARLNLAPVSIRPIQVDRNGSIADVAMASERPYSKWEGFESVELRFRTPDGEERRVIYLSMDLSDRALKAHPGRIDFYRSLGNVSGLLKAGSYLMHSPRFSTMRNIMLEQATIVVQDDSGIPLAVFSERQWTLQLFGVYTAPIRLFQQKAQPALRDRYAQGAEPLPFPWGYGNDAKQTNLLLARRHPRP